MAAIALQMRNLSASVRDDTRKKEEADLQIRIAEWKKQQKEKARNAIALLPTAIKDVAAKGKSYLIVQVEVAEPFVRLDINDTYKVLGMWDFPSLLETDTPRSGEQLSLNKVRNLREGARAIARWALKQGFTVHFRKWEDRLSREDIRHYDFFKVDEVTTPVFACSRHGGYPVDEGFMIAW